MCKRRNGNGRLEAEKGREGERERERKNGKYNNKKGERDMLIGFDYSDAATN